MCFFSVNVASLVAQRILVHSNVSYPSTSQQCSSTPVQLCVVIRYVNLCLYISSSVYLSCVAVTCPARHQRTFKMPQCNLSPNGTHRYAPSPTTLSSVTCLHCKHIKLCTKSKCASKYVKYRRAMQHTRGLRNITVCLEKESVQSLNNVLAEAGVKGRSYTLLCSREYCPKAMNTWQIETHRSLSIKSSCRVRSRPYDRL